MSLSTEHQPILVLFDCELSCSYGRFIRLSSSPKSLAPAAPSLGVWNCKSSLMISCISSLTGLHGRAWERFDFFFRNKKGKTKTRNPWFRVGFESCKKMKCFRLEMSILLFEQPRAEHHLCEEEVTELPPSPFCPYRQRPHREPAHRDCHGVRDCAGCQRQQTHLPAEQLRSQRPRGHPGCQQRRAGTWPFPGTLGWEVGVPHQLCPDHELLEGQGRDFLSLCVPSGRARCVLAHPPLCQSRL